MDKFCILTNKNKDHNYRMTNKIRDHLLQQGKTVYLPQENTKPHVRPDEVDVSMIPEDAQVILVLGGDGTLIKVARNLASLRIPFLGVNLGTKGYLASTEKEDIISCLDALIVDDYSLEKRMMLKAGAYKNKDLYREVTALNEIIVSWAGFSKLVEIKLYVNGRLAEEYPADGVIVATPTSSTAYNLWAGRPVIFPETETIVITPICPHSLTTRSIVVAPTDKVRVEVGKRRATATYEEAQVVCDGQPLALLRTHDYVDIERSDLYVNLVKVGDRNFYDVLRNKIVSTKKTR